MTKRPDNPEPLAQRNLPQMDGRDWPVFEPGWVWMTGGGPGDPGLITLHALNALQQADVIIYDALVDEALLRWARPEARVEYAGKRGGKPSPSQRDISLRLIELARQDMRVLRLKGGDPFVFGRGGEEAQTLVQAGVRLRVIPGISAGIGGLAYAGIPVTHRDVNQSVTFLSGHDRTGLTPSAIDWNRARQQRAGHRHVHGDQAHAGYLRKADRGGTFPERTRGRCSERDTRRHEGS